ncbi:putative nucleotidyltransferase substrate binding domain-containing protein [Gordonia sp. CPCC 205515]|uniref:putative nucleotidyltransferase substrate binding domain-containing protein n=1 Tax=Gordonia sp. CPCC 205515 TaxID=3140791 RepID=UPI003AF3D3D7
MGADAWGWPDPHPRGPPPAASPDGASLLPTDGGVVSPATATTLLRGHPPFDALTDEQLAGLLERAENHQFESGATIFDGYSTPADAIYAVISGQVELFNIGADQGEADETLGPGGVFGYSSLLTKTLVGPRAVAAGPVTICLIPGDAARSLFSGVRGAQFVADKLTVARRRDAQTHTQGTVDALIVSAPVIGRADMTVADAARLMTDRHQEYVIFVRDDGYRVVTDADIRARVVAAGLSTDTVLSDVVDAPARVVYRDTAAADALTEILDHDLAAVPVLDPSGVVCGVVGPADFIAAPAGPSMSLRRQVSRAATIDDLVASGGRVPYLVADLLRRGQPVYEVTALASLVNDAIVRRAIELTLRSHPELDPAALTWLSLGSNARREPVLASDVDSAVSFDDSVTDEQIVGYRQAFAEVDEVLRRAGMAIDTNGAIASMPLFARTHAQWRAAARLWLGAPLENKGMIFTSLLLDGRPIWGDQGLSAVGEVFADLRSHPGTLGLLLQESLSHKARLRSVRDVLTRRGGTFDIKHHALTPLVNIARWAALSVGSGELGTRGRLMAAAGSPMMPADSAQTLVEVFDVLQRVRLTYQVAQFDRGEQVSDVLNMKRLSPLDRSLVAQAVREITGVQRRMTNMSHYMSIAE